MKLQAVVTLVAIALAGGAPIIAQDHTADVAVAAYSVQHFQSVPDNVTHLQHLIDHVTFDPQRFTLLKRAG